MSYSGREIPKGTQSKSSPNPGGRDGRSDGTSAINKGIAKRRFSNGWRKTTGGNPEAKENNQRGNPLKKGIIGRGYRRNQNASGEIMNSSASTVKPLN